MEHHEFLSDNSTDPRLEITKSLCQVIGKVGSIVAYHTSFEKGRLGELAEWSPKFRDQIRDYQDRLWDLLPVIRAHVYDLAFEGSYSLKKVLPALVPDMKYKGMLVSEGSEAGLKWEEMLQSEVGTEERARLRNALLAYCKQDTLAMVKLLEVLYQHSG